MATSAGQRLMWLLNGGKSARCHESSQSLVSITIINDYSSDTALILKIDSMDCVGYCENLKTLPLLSLEAMQDC